MVEKQVASRRIWELDFFRGLALILMIVFHIVFDLKEIYSFNIEYEKGFYFFVAKTAAILFMLISGVSCNLSRNNVKRGLKVFALAIVITVITHLYGEEFGIKFGILHFMGISMLLYPLLNKFGNITLTVSATLIIIVGNIFTGIVMPNNYFFIFNLTSNSFMSSDYYPILPWIGIFIYGIVIGRFLYKDKNSIFKFNLRNNIISEVGKHTLVIYIVHQPLILVFLEIFNKFMK